MRWQNGPLASHGSATQGNQGWICLDAPPGLGGTRVAVSDHARVLHFGGTRPRR